MLVEAILRCLIKLVHLLDKSSIFLKHLFWISVVVMQVCMSKCVCCVCVCMCVCVHRILLFLPGSGASHICVSPTADA